MNQGQNKEVVKYNKSNKYYDWSDKNQRYCKDKNKTEDGIGIITTFANEKNRCRDCN